MAEAEPAAPRRWVPVPLPLPELGRSESFELEGRSLLLCNAEGRPYVIHDECPHVQTSLRDGAIRGTILECPLHGGQLDLRDGSPVSMPIRRPVACFEVRETSDGGLEVALPDPGANGA